MVSWSCDGPMKIAGGPATSDVGNPDRAEAGSAAGIDAKTGKYSFVRPLPNGPPKSGGRPGRLQVFKAAAQGYLSLR